MNRQFTLDTKIDPTHSIARADDIAENQPNVIETVLEAESSPSDTKHAAEVEQIAGRLRHAKRMQRRRALYGIVLPLLCLPLILTMEYIQHLGDGGLLNPERRIALLHQIWAGIALTVIGCLVSLVLLLSTSYARWRIWHRAKRLAFGFGDAGENKIRKATGNTEAIADIVSIGSLTEMLEIDSIPVRNMAKARLTHLLPQLKANDASLLNPSQRKRLNLFLGAHRFDLGYRDIRELWSKQARQRDTDFQFAILKAYEQVGDADCLPAVRSLAHPAPHYAKIAPPELVEEARHCLEFLEKLVEQNKMSKQLLRASSVPEAMPNTLLRAAMSHANAEEANSLLRATDA